MTKYQATHVACPDCGSSDARTIFADGWSECFSCGKRTPPKGSRVKKKVTEPVTEGWEVPGSPKAIPHYNITADTAKKYGIHTDGDKTHFVYTDKDGTPVAAKTRSEVDGKKKFTISGAWGSREPLYGMHLFSPGGKYVTVTEGERDAGTGFQMAGSKWPFVSVSDGAGNALKNCRAAFEWLNSFEHVVICFDNDEVGKKAAAQVAELFGAKARIVRLRKHKDASDYLAHGDAKEFIESWWNAEKFTPDGIVNGSALHDEVMKPLAKPDALYPWEGLNKLTYGIRQAELVTITAGSGLGKSQVLREVMFHLLHKTDANIGGLFLEESVRKTGLGLMSLAANKPLHLPTTETTDEEKEAAYKETLGTGRIWLHDHFGSTAIDNIVAKVRYMAKALECKFIFLDHITIIVSSMENPDERKALDEIMTKLRMLVQETGITLFVVSHLKRPEGKGHEEGASTSLAQLRGSGSIAQLSDMVIGLERNGQHDDEKIRNTTKVRVLKNRFAGVTGPACELVYNHETGRIAEEFEESL